ncbi:MAG: uroporphyrinogen decarboxylase family protein [Victivallaceae bacterium]|nr:uroporphyrinogen decarboxylase family protein [Victivallaceae bacterium]
MPQNSREIVKRCLDFDYPERLPVDIWVLPWAQQNRPSQTATLLEKYPSDFACPANIDYSKIRRGDPYRQGIYVDEWGCVFENIHDGIIGEVKQPVIENIDDWDRVRPPYAILPENTRQATDKINRSCENTEKFIKAGCCPRPWERFQFLRGTENALIDIMMLQDGVEKLLRKIHDFYLKELEFWVKTEVDAISFMDDWGTQKSLLIPPDIWRDLFKPLYKDYCDLAKANGKYIFMHSDGCITEIFPDLIELGVNALNSQIFCMDMDELARMGKGKITFWGEMDRQHVLVSMDPEVGRKAVKLVAEKFYDPRGGIIAQLELGPGFVPETVLAVMEAWETLWKNQSLDDAVE